LGSLTLPAISPGVCMPHQVGLVHSRSSGGFFDALGGGPSLTSCSSTASAGGSVKPGPERGSLAAAWGKRLPEATRMPPSLKGLHHAARGHMAPVEASLKSREPARLEAVLQEQSGANFLRTMAKVRKSRSVPHLQKQALESALASHMVRARAELGRWQAGMRQIHKACDSREVDSLASALKQWDFADDVPEVIEAREKLAKWREVAAEVKPTLKAALASNDLAALRSAVKRLDAKGPCDRDVEGAAEARAALERYSARTRRLRYALAARNTQVVESALKAWEFDLEDPLYTSGQQMLQRREQQLQELHDAAVESPPDGQRLGRAVEAWEFDARQQELIRASDLHKLYVQEDAALRSFAQSAPAGLVRLSAALASWSFAPEQGEGYEAARAALLGYQQDVQAALEARDARTLRRLWEAPGSGAAALSAALGMRNRAPEEEEEDGNGSDDAMVEADIEGLLLAHAESEPRLRDAVAQARTLDAEAEPEIANLVEDWPFSSSDPAVLGAQAWLRLRAGAAGRSAQELRQAAATGCAEVARGALNRMQGLPADSEEVEDARRICEDCARARYVGYQAAVASGTAPGGAGQTMLELREQADDAMRRARRLAEGITDADVLALRGSLPSAPPAVQKVGEILVCLLGWSPSASSEAEGAYWDAAPPTSGQRWKHAVKMLSDSRFREALMQAPQWAGVGYPGVARAAEMDAELLVSLGEQKWSLSALRERSPPAAALLGFCRAVAECGTAARRAQAARAEALGSPPAPSACAEARALEEDFCMAWLEAPLLSVAWLARGGDLAALHEGVERLRAHAAATEQALKAASDALAECAWGSLPDAAQAVKDRRRSAGPLIELTVQRVSGEEVLSQMVDGGAPVSRLKEALAKTTSISVSALKLVLEGKGALQDALSLVEQGVESKDVLTLVQMPPPLLRRLERCRANIEELEPKDIDSSSSQAALKPIEELHLADGLAPVPAMLDAVDRAIAELRSAGSGIPPPAQLAADAAHSQGPIEFSGSFVPVAGLAAASSAVDPWVTGRLAVVVTEFVQTIPFFFEHYMPLRAAWAAAVEAAAEAANALQRAKVSLAAATCLEGLATACSTEASGSGASGVGEHAWAVVLHAEDGQSLVQALASAGCPLPARLLVRAQSAASSATRALLAAASSPERRPVAVGDKLRWVHEVLSGQLGPFSFFVEELSSLAGLLSESELAALVPRSGPLLRRPTQSQRGFASHPGILALAAALCWLLQRDCRDDLTWPEAGRWMGNGSEVLSAMRSWQPLELVGEGVARLERARLLLIDQLPWLASGCDGNQAAAKLFAWAATAASLAPPLLLEASELRPVLQAVAAAMAHRDSASGGNPESQDAAAWADARAELHRVGDPTWWLRLCGCEAKAAKDLYNSLGLAPDKQGGVETDAGEALGTVGEEGEGEEGEDTYDDFPNEADGDADDGGAEDGDFEQDGDGEERDSKAEKTAKPGLAVETGDEDDDEFEPETPHVGGEDAPDAASGDEDDFEPPSPQEGAVSSKSKPGEADEYSDDGNEFEPTTPNAASAEDYGDSGTFEPSTPAGKAKGADQGGEDDEEYGDDDFEPA